MDETVDGMKWLETTRTWRDREGVWNSAPTLINLRHVRRVLPEGTTRSKVLWAVHTIDPMIVAVPYEQFVQQIRDL
jgi:hypothetical protein